MSSNSARLDSDLPLVTVITVVLNGEKYLEQAMLSVINQTYSTIEYIVIDGGSTDGTLSIIKRYEEKIEHWESGQDKGIYDAMNKGLALAKGELIVLLNADDFYEPDLLNVMVNRYLEERAEAIFHCNSFMIEEDMGMKYKLSTGVKPWRGMPFCHQAMFVHRDVYEKIGAYDLKYKMSADYDFVLRALKQNVEFIHIDKYMVNYRNTGLSTRNVLLTLREKKRINKKAFGFYSLNHLKYLAVYSRSLVLIGIQKLIQLVFGDKILVKARTVYTKIFFSKSYKLAK